MNALHHPPPNPLASGFYTIPEAARLIEVGSVRRITGWLRGYPSSEIGPLLHRDFDPIGDKEELSFLDLMEVRFVEFFREEGVHIRTLRKALQTARKVFREDKPLTSSRIVFRTTEDRKNIFVEEILRNAAEETADKRLLSLLNAQYEIYDFMESKLAKGVEFDPFTTLAQKWHPRKEQFPAIFIDPAIAYGQPITPGHIPTRGIYDAWRAGDDKPTISGWFSAPLEEVEQAIAFEQSLANKTRPTIH